MEDGVNIGDTEERVDDEECLNNQVFSDGSKEWKNDTYRLGMDFEFQPPISEERELEERSI